MQLCQFSYQPELCELETFARQAEHCSSAESEPEEREKADSWPADSRKRSDESPSVAVRLCCSTGAPRSDRNAGDLPVLPMIIN